MDEQRLAALADLAKDGEATSGDFKDRIDEEGKQSWEAIEDEGARPKGQETGRSHFGHNEKYG